MNQIFRGQAVSIAQVFVIVIDNLEDFLAFDGLAYLFTQFRHLE